MPDGTCRSYIAKCVWGTKNGRLGNASRAGSSSTQTSISVLICSYMYVHCATLAKLYKILKNTLR